MTGQKSSRIFESDFLESISRSHPALNTGAAAALAAICFFFVDFGVLGWAGATALAAATIGAWTLVEYVTHRYFFHWTPRNARLERVLYLVHRYHHDFPNERSRNMFPIVVSLPMAIVAFAALVALMPWNSALFAFAVLVLCFAGYDLVHYQHHVPTPFLPALRRRHMLHHFRGEEVNFGVTTSFWDKAFGTLGPEPVAPPSSSVAAWRVWPRKGRRA